VPDRLTLDEARRIASKERSGKLAWAGWHRFGKGEADVVLVMIFNILVALALGFVFGRIYQIRRYELERRDGFTLPPTAQVAQQG
jgi:hypothetical protein